MSRGHVLGRREGTFGGRMVGDPGQGVPQEQSGRCPGWGEAEWAGEVPHGRGAGSPSGWGSGACCGHCRPLILQQLGIGVHCAALLPPGFPVRVSPCLWLNLGLDCGKPVLWVPGLPESWVHSLAVGALQTEICTCSGFMVEMKQFGSRWVVFFLSIATIWCGFLQHFRSPLIANVLLWTQNISHFTADLPSCCPSLFPR